ncbi:MAG TPA: hypothetical protein VFO85_13475, partial [Vicinamibacteria bacterium]|nr:hypothetical protein [Vicinamibacteria bacterium]
MLARRVLLLIAAWAVLLGALVMAPGRPTPLLVNLGAGDEPFARGFRGGWERDGLLGSGETQFRWTLDGARLQLPFSLRARAAVARLRLARFAATPAEITLLAGPREVARWRQPPRGWRVQEVPLGALHGPLVLHFRSQAPAAGPGEADLGLALDWVELQGVTRAWPSPRLLPGLLALLVGAPLLVGLATRRLDACLASAVAAAAVSAGAFWCDRLAGPVAVSSAGPPLLLLTALILGAAHALGRRWPGHIAPWPAAAPALALALVALVVLSHPFFHYPDVDTHARFVRALRDDGTLLLDTRGYQAQTGAWTREVAGRRIAFPYSPVF